MRELVGRVAALDVVASEGLEVISYFDTLVEQRSGIEGIVRATSAFADSPAGFIDPDRRLRIRVDVKGHEHATDTCPEDPASTWPSLLVGTDSLGTVWIERLGPPRATDSLVLERMAASVRITLERQTGSPLNAEGAVEILLDSDADLTLRTRSASVLGLDMTGWSRVIALPPGRRTDPSPPYSAVLQSPVGQVRALIATERLAQPNLCSTDPAGSRVGVGTVGTGLELPGSWSSALAALRLTSPFDPQVRADEAGPLLALAEVYGPGRRQGPDALGELASKPWVLATAHSLANSDSIRDAARQCNVHHSTMTARAEQLASALGYPTTGSAGRFRLALDLAVHWLVSNVFEFEDPAVQ
jgi:hypothetical protein